jgi:hypothetical protein
MQAIAYIPALSSVTPSKSQIKQEGLPASASSADQHQQQQQQQQHHPQG